MNENHIVKTEILTADRGRFTAGTMIIGVATVGAAGRGQLSVGGDTFNVDDVFVHSVAEVIEHLGRGVPYRFAGNVVGHAGGQLVYYLAGATHRVPVPSTRSPHETRPTNRSGRLRARGGALLRRRCAARHRRHRRCVARRAR
ncbi:MAG: hypothetical protein K8W52_43680 [Deltaproteobacteria bacterium]|nr:hypothetical protein [Deltaproteobacteria bacterium]